MNNNSIATMKVILSALIGSVTLDSIINSKYSAFAIPSTGDSRTVLYPITGKESPSQLLGYVKNSAGKSVTGHLSCPPWRSFGLCSCRTSKTRSLVTLWECEFPTEFINSEEHYTFCSLCRKHLMLLGCRQRGLSAAKRMMTTMMMVSNEFINKRRDRLNFARIFAKRAT